MIIVTGGTGFIGSNIVRSLNLQGQTDILIVDDLTDGHKFKNIVNCQFTDYIDKTDLIDYLDEEQSFLKQVTAIFHEGACSSTTEWDGRFMMDNNYEYSKALLHFCLESKVPFIYASSAAIYGCGQNFVEDPINESPLNVYGFSKFLFDRYVRRHMRDANSQIVGLRYFNVYGPNEQHKDSMASVAWHAHQQVLEHGNIKLFEGCDGYGNGEQRRDFVFIDDVANVNLWFLTHPEHSGIFNVGTGRSQSFNELANAVLAWHKKGEIEYIPFPEHLVGKYQSFTEADISALRALGYDADFAPVEVGVLQYLERISSKE